MQALLALQGDGFAVLSGDDPTAARSLMWEKSAGDGGKRWLCMANGYCDAVYPEEFTEMTRR